MVGDLAPGLVWEALGEAKAVLVDVRTPLEWGQVGVPDLSGVGKAPVLIPWQVPPSMQVNPDFVAQMRAAGVGPENSVYFLCRSGVRSLAAARAAEAAGYERVFNITDGFEGPPGPGGQRGVVSGWQASGLPWTKDQAS